MNRLPTVVLPIHNALEALDGCLASLDRTLPAGSRVLLADDASSDPRIEPLAQGWAGRSALDVRYLRRERHLGLSANCNAAFADTGDDDLVLLDTGTITTAGWLQQIARCATSDPRIATATPWSNDAEICSFPRFCEANPVPEHPDAVAEAAAGLSPPEYPDLPAAPGFCLYLRRAALRQLGGFDAETFGGGHGGYSDFCLRAAAMGWRNVLCGTAYVARPGAASSAPVDLAADGDHLARLLARWPDHNERVARFIMADPLRPLRARLADRIEALARSGPQRDLFG